MPGQLRTRLRRALTGAEGTGPLRRIKAGKASKTPDPDDDYYKPGEKMPPLKYRRAVDPEHKKALEAFSFKTAWRRRSHQSLYSPMGSRLPSRRNSFRSRRSRSRSMAKSRRSSFSASSDYDAEEWVDSGIGASIAGDDRPANIKEASDDEGDVLNVGLSRNPTEDPRDPKWKQASHRRSSSTQLGATRPGTATDRTPRSSQPFTAEDLELALEKSNLEATTDESDKSSAGSSSYDDFDEPDLFLRPRGGSIYVPYDGQGTPPKLPFWGSANPDNEDHSSAAFSRRASVFLVHSGSCTPKYERRQSIFASPMSRRHSVFVANDDDVDPPRSTAIFVADDCQEPTHSASSFAPTGDKCECAPAKVERPIRKPQPTCPSDAIAAILARSDIK